MKPGGQKSYPNTVFISGSTWEVKFSRKIVDGCDGLCDPSIKTIYLKQKQGKVELFKTLLHEALHAYGEELDIEIPHKIIYKMEDIIIDFIFNNEQALKRIFEKE